MAIIDCFTFNGEYDLLEIRLNILNDYVDEFIIVEAPTTFSGKPKPLYYEQGKDRYKQWHHKIKYFVIDENYTPEEIAQAENSQNTRGAAHWKREFLQKESIKKALTHLKDGDIVFIGDVDEIVRPESVEAWGKFTGSPFKIKLDVYSYYLNNRSSEEFYGTLVSKYWHVRTDCLNHLRSNSWKSNLGGGWHFTSMGGYEEVKRKLSDSYTRESYWTEGVENNLKNNVENSKDFLGRGFVYTVDESNWPQFLKDNKQKYAHLCKS